MRNIIIENIEIIIIENNRDNSERNDNCIASSPSIGNILWIKS